MQLPDQASVHEYLRPQLMHGREKVRVGVSSVGAAVGGGKGVDVEVG
jgi:hypothetical protein